MHPKGSAAVALLIGIVFGAGCAAPAATTPPATPARVVTSAPSAPAQATPVPILTPTPPPTVDDIGAARIRVPVFVDWVVIADGTPWVSMEKDATERGAAPLDPETGEIGPLVPFAGVTCTGFDVGYDSIWSATCENRSLTRIDPQTREVAATIELPTTGDVAEEGSVGAGEGGVWVVTTEPSLIKVRKDGKKVLGTWPLPKGAAAVRAGLGALWVTVPEADLLLRIDPDDPDRRTDVAVGKGPRFLAIGEGAVWTMDAVSKTVTKVGPSGDVLATIEVASQPIRGGDITVGGGYVWARTWDSLVVRIDPESGETVRLGPDSGSGGVAADDTAAWITAHDINTIWRLPLPMPEP